jgi:hypothetical protein
LVYFADFLRLQGKFTDAAIFLERCLFAFESALSYEFNYVPQSQEAVSTFVPQTRIDFTSPKADPLNQVFGEAIIKYIDILGRRGTNRTAVEFNKLLLSFDPVNDPFGVLLRIDYYAIRAKEYTLLQDFVRQFPDEIYPDSGRASILVLPNFIFTVPLAKFFARDNEIYS